MVRSLVDAVIGGAVVDEKLRKPETFSVSLTAKGNSCGVNPTKTKCEPPLREKLGNTNLFRSFSETLEFFLGHTAQPDASATQAGAANTSAARMATRANHAIAGRGLPIGSCRGQGLVAEDSGVRRTWISRRRRLHGSGKLGDRSGRRSAVRLHASQRYSRLESDGDSASGTRIKARRRHWTRSRAGVPRSLLQASRVLPVDRLRDCDLGVRSRGSHRNCDRAQPAVSYSDRLWGADHNPGRAPRAVSAEQGIQTARSAGHRAHRNGRRVFSVRDHSLAAAIWRCDARIHSEDRSLRQPQNALRRGRDTGGDGDAAQSLSAFLDRADPPIRGDTVGEARGSPLRVHRLDDRALVRALHQCRDSHHRGGDVSYFGSQRSRRDSGRLQAADAAPPWLRRLITRAIAIVPAAIVAIMYGESGTAKLLVLSQVVLSMQLSFAVFPLVG